MPEAFLLIIADDADFIDYKSNRLLPGIQIDHHCCPAKHFKYRLKTSMVKLFSYLCKHGRLLIL